MGEEQLNSSDSSVQSFFPSQNLVISIHSPFLQLNSSKLSHADEMGILDAWVTGGSIKGQS